MSESQKTQDGWAGALDWSTGAYHRRQDRMRRLQFYVTFASPLVMITAGPEGMETACAAVLGMGFYAHFIERRAAPPACAPYLGIAWSFLTLGVVHAAAHSNAAGLPYLVGWAVLLLSVAWLGRRRGRDAVKVPPPAPFLPTSGATLVPGPLITRTADATRTGGRP